MIFQPTRPRPRARDPGRAKVDIEPSVWDQHYSALTRNYRFPVGWHAKVPSVVYYSQDGRVLAVGAEPKLDDMDATAKEANWVKAERFMLHLHPRIQPPTTDEAHIPTLPLGKTAVEVLSDLLRYLNDCAREYIQESHPRFGAPFWDGRGIHFILSHPNGVGVPQKALMRQAAQAAGLTEPGGRNQLTLIAKGEANLYRCIEKGLMDDSIWGGDGIAIVDAGHYTVEISTWASKNEGRTFKETTESQCYVKGSASVTKAAEEYLDKLLKNSRFHRDVPEMGRYFDRITKHSFCDPSDPQFIRFGSARDREARLKITTGALRLEGKEVASFFEPSVKCIVDGVLAQCRTTRKPISTVFLVGGFAASDYLLQRMKVVLEPHGLQVIRPDTQVNKAVADGAIFAALDRLSDSVFELVEGFVPHNPEAVEVFRPDVPANETNMDDATSSVSEHPTHTPAITPIVATPPQSPTIATPPQPPTPDHTPAVTTSDVAPSHAPPSYESSDHFNNLTDDNYSEWKVYMTAALTRNGLLGVVDGTESHPRGAEGTKKVKKFRAKQARACAEIILHVSPSQLIHCSGEDPALIWKALAIAHAVHKRATINSLRRQFHKLRLEHDETMSAFIKRAYYMASLLDEAGVGVDEDTLIILITSGLPRSYDSVLAFLDNLPESEYSFDSIIAFLLTEYQRQISIALPTREDGILATAALPIPDEIVVSTPYS